MTPGSAVERSYRDVASVSDMYIVTVYQGLSLEKNRFEQVCVFEIHTRQQVARLKSEQMAVCVFITHCWAGPDRPRAPGRTTHAGPGARAPGRFARVLSVCNVVMKKIAIGMLAMAA